MKKYYIEDIHVGISKGGIACGPVPGNIIGEILLRSQDGKATYHCMAEVCGTLNFYESEVSLYQGLINEDFDNLEFTELMENCFSEGYSSFYDFYEEANSLEPLSISVLIRKFLAYVVRADWSEVYRLKENTIGRIVGDFDIPLCDEEKEYLEEITM